MNKPELPPILNTKEYESLVEKYKQEEEKQRQYVINLTALYTTIKQ